jgi:SNF2 family DNA or RNA helicase
MDLTEAQQAKNMRQCPMCREPISRDKIFRASAFFNPEEQEDIKPVLDGEGDAGPSGVKSSLGKRSVSLIIGPSRHIADLQSEEADDDVKPGLKKLALGKGKGKATDYTEKVKSEKDEKPVAIDLDGIEITPSTKMRHLLEVIQQKLEDPTAKIVAYSQFTSFLDLCGAYLRAQGISVLQYQGSMSAPERQECLDRFNTPTDLEGGHHRVLLLSLKAGGVGLNLTISNVVVALDLAWNAATGMSISFVSDPMFGNHN